MKPRSPKTSAHGEGAGACAHRDFVAFFAIAGASLLGSACTAAAGAGAATVAVAAGALASTCYGYVDVTVVDSTTGGPTCDAEVVARDQDDSETTLRSCFHASLGEGSWKVTASKPGYVPFTSEVEIKTQDCARIVYSLVMTLEPVGQGPRELQKFRPRPERAPHAPSLAPATVGTTPAPRGTTETPASAEPAEPKPEPSAAPAPSGGSSGTTPIAPTLEPKETPKKPDEKPVNPYLVP